MPNGHKIILNQLFKYIDKRTTDIIDLGSGRTSLASILEYFPQAFVDAIVYPGDLRKINTITNIAPVQDRYRLVEFDLCTNKIDRCYDLAVAHLLLGEANKFGNSTDSLINHLLSVKFKHLILIDYLEDKSICFSRLEEIFCSANLTINEKVVISNADPQDFGEFIGYHNIGYLIERQQYSKHSAPYR